MYKPISVWERIFLATIIDSMRVGWADWQNDSQNVGYSIIPKQVLWKCFKWFEFREKLRVRGSLNDNL